MPLTPKRVLVTGASGFVGRHVVRCLMASGHHPVCFVRNTDRMRALLADAAPGQYTVAAGSPFDESALRQASRDIDAAVHLIGIILERRRFRGQSFRRVHVEAAQRVLEAARAAGASRFLHMSALGTRPGAVSRYHRTKWEAESFVRASGLAFTIFRPSVIHGPDGEFMQLMKRFVCGLVPPVIPYFGRGAARLQPVSVRDVAHCFAAALDLERTAGQVYELGGPKTYTWKELYETCRRLIPGASRYKPKVSVPLPVAKLIGLTGDAADFLIGTRLLIPFNLAQVQMSQEENTCDTRPVEEAFDIRMRDFEEELALYAGRIH